MHPRKLFKHCPRCQAALQPAAEDVNYMRCDQCSFQYFFNPAPASAAIIRNEAGHVLLVRRATDPGRGLWDLPGGFIDEGESAEEGTLREIQEEVGIPVEGVEYYMSGAETYTYGEVTYNVLTVVFLANAVETEVQLQKEELTDWQFVPVADIDISQVAFTVLQDALRKYQQEYGK